MRATVHARTCLFYSAFLLLGCKKQIDPGHVTKGAPIATPIARAAYVTNNGSDTVSVIDRDGDRVENVAVDVDPHAHEAPHHLAIDVPSGALYVALAFPAPPEKKGKRDPHAAHGRADDPGKLAWLDLRTLGVSATRDVDESPGDVVLTNDRRRLIVTHYDMKRAMEVALAGGTAGAMAATLQVWDARTKTKIAERAVCVAPHGVVTTPDDALAIIACYGSDELALVDLNGPGLPTQRFPLGAQQQGVAGAPRYGPYSATLTPDAARVVVADLEGADLRVFDRAAKAFLADKTMTIGARVMMPDFVTGRAIVAPLQGPDGIARIDVERGEIEARVPTPADVCQSPHVARKAKDGRVYVVCEGDHVAPGAVVEVDPVSLAIKRRWVVGVYPDGIVFGD